MVTPAMADTKQLVRVKAADLHRIVSNAAIFADTDETLATINCVEFDLKPTHLVTVGCTRFVLGVSTLPVSSTESTVFRLRLREIAQLVKAAKTLKRDADRFVDISQLYDGSVMFKFSDGITLDLPTSRLNYVTWRGLFPTDTGVETAIMAYTAEYLALFAKVVPAETMTPTMRTWTHDNTPTARSRKPVTVKIGDGFAGLIMPVKLPEGQHDWTVPDWF
jgi:hypothetical protein